MTKLALIAGTGKLPAHLVNAVGGDVLVCEMAGFPVSVPEETEIIRYRVETLGTLLQTLQARGISEVCFAGVIHRPKIDPAAIDMETVPLLPQIQAAIAQGGDDAALRVVLTIFEDRGLTIRAAHQIAPDLLPSVGVMCGEVTDRIHADAQRADATLRTIAVADIGQSCVVLNRRVVAVEAAPGTDWMLRSLRDGEAEGGVFYKAPKKGQDRRIDMPTIGPETIRCAAWAGLKAVIVAAGGVQVMEPGKVIALAEKNGITVWVRP